MKKLSLVGILFVSAVVLSACTGASNQDQQNGSEAQPTTPPVTESANQDSANLVESAQEYDIVMDNHSFSETNLVVKAGEEVVINLTNEEGYHDLVIDELDVHSEHLKVGENEVLTFTVNPEHIGQTYEFYCSVGSHREQGMVGTIQIIE